MTEKRDAYRNFAALTSDFVLFSIGFAFYDPVIVVPAFVKTFTGSELMVGVLAALRVLTIALPQVWAASVLVARPRKRPLLIASSLFGRLPLLLLALATVMWAGKRPWLAVSVLSLTVACFFISEGINGVTWPALVAKVIPETVRGRFFGLGQLLSSLGAGVSGYAVSAILNQGTLALATRWALLFACAFVGLMFSVLVMVFIREEAEPVTTSQVDVWQGITSMLGYLRQDARLRRVVVTQLVLGTAAATFPFFVVRAKELFPMEDQLIGVFLAMQSLGGVIAALACGYLVDHVGSWAAVRLSAAMQVVALSMVALARLSSISQALYIVAFLLLGFVTGSSWWSFSNYLLDMAAPEQRPIYLATSGVLTSPVFISAIVVGGLFEVLVPEVIFTGALALSLGGLALAWALRTSKKSTKGAL